MFAGFQGSQRFRNVDMVWGSDHQGVNIPAVH
jgi:hypothetical protein